MKIHLLPLFLIGASLSGAALSFVDAQPRTSPLAPKVEAQLQAFRVVRAGEKESLLPATTAKPGDLIEYQARYTNTGRGAAQGFSPQLPVPAAMIYQGSSAFPARVLATLDGKTWALAPLKRTIKNADGTSQVVAVPLAEYRALKWNMGALAAGETALVKARMTVARNGR